MNDKNPRKIMAFTLLLLFECMITLEMFLSLLSSFIVVEEIVVMLLSRYADSDFI
jgi:hypothetical protein